MLRGGGGGEALQEEISDLGTKFSQLLDALSAFNKTLEEVYHQSTEDDPELENSLTQFKKVKVKMGTHLNALSNVQAGDQSLEHITRLTKPLEDLEILSKAFQASFSSLFETNQNTHSSQTSSTQEESAPKPAPQTAPSNAPEVKPLWKYGPNTLQAFQDYMKAKDLGSAGAWLELGKMSAQGIVLYPDNNVAMRCFEKAIELGSVGALVELGKLYIENGDTQILEYGSGEIINGQDVINALRPLNDDVESEDYLEILKACQVFRDKSTSGCYQKAKELFEKAVSLGEGRGYLGLDNWYWKTHYVKGDEKKSQECREKSEEYGQKAIELLKAQAKKGDIEAYALWGYALEEMFGGVNQGDAQSKEIMDLYQKAIDSSYADGYKFLGFFDADRRKSHYTKGAKLGSGLCALALARSYEYPNIDELPHSGHGNLNDFKLMAEQAVGLVDRLLEPIRLFEFVALTCKHHRVLPWLLKYLSIVKEVSYKAKLGGVDRYQKFLKASYKSLSQALVRPNMQLAKDLGEASWAQENERERFGIGFDQLRAFTNPARDQFYMVNQEGEVEIDAEML
ncbi:tetratricopeptide repeat protein [Helicobacter salomonis]|uniref:tetratricopeptide repeat protein n=1 Tax=Helicobacter salomonis TaxID=56878 RepID=UPI000CF0605E|nr:sel1 repeat family protein [Helicobacter salomonis]